MQEQGNNIWRNQTKIWVLVRHWLDARITYIHITLGPRLWKQWVIEKINTGSARTRRGGNCLRVITIRPFPSIELACAVRQPGPCVGALCEPVALLLSKNMTCARPLQRQANTFFTLHTALFTPRTSHFTSHLHFTPHTSANLKSGELFSPYLTSQLFTSHPISSHMSSK